MLAVDSRSLRRSLLALTSAALAGLLAVSSVLASTPVTHGYRDFLYGGGAARPSGDKPQSKLWYTDGTWFAGMFLYRTSPTPKSEYHIYSLNESTNAWVDKGTIVDTRDTSHGDYLWDEGSQTLYVASTLPIPDVPPTIATDDAIKVFKYTYNATTNVYTAVGGFPKSVVGTASVPNVSAGGSPSVTIAKDSGGDLWLGWAKDTEVRYSRSTDGGATWSAPLQVPVQAGNPINEEPQDDHQDTTGIIAFGTKVGIAWSDQDNLPASTDNGYYFASIDAGADPTVSGNWAIQKLPTLASPGQIADNHINLKTTADGSVYMVGKTGKDTLNCATNKNAPLIEFFKRSAAGTWTVHLVGTVGDCNTRPQLAISEQLDTAYVFLTSINGGGYIGVKSAPLSGSEAFKFRGAADDTIQRGTPFIQSATETLIDDPSTTKQNVTAASGIVVLANNLTKVGTTNAKYYLHNKMTLLPTDPSAPSGTIAIANGAAGTTTADVTVNVPATDAASGVSLVRLSNSSAESGGVLSTGTTFVYDATVPWTLSGGDGIKTVYAQWRDAKGNWSGVSSDTIDLDATAPTGTVVINNDDAETGSASVTLTLTADDSGGSGVTQVLISNTNDFTGVTPVAYATTIQWFLTPGNGSKTVYVKFIDGAGNVSASPVSDSITLNSTDITAPSAPGAPRHAISGNGSAGIPMYLVWNAGTDNAGGSGVAGYILQQSVNGGAFATIATPTTQVHYLTLSNSSKNYRYRVATIDGAGNVSAYATGPTFQAITYNESSSNIAYVKTWSLTNSSIYVGGKARSATVANSSATISFRGRTVGWLGLTGPTSGVAKVYVDGTLKATINLNDTTTTARNLLYTKAWATAGNHTVKVVVSGSSGRVTIDQFLVLR